jgi:hypothetical protein
VGTGGRWRELVVGACCGIAMSAVGSAVRLVAVFSAGVVTAAFFLSRPVEPPAASRPSLVESSNPRPAQPTSTGSSSSQTGQDQLPSHPVRVIPIPRPGDEGDSRVGPQTTGSAEQAEATTKPRASCNREACSRSYSSFDEESCTYTLPRIPSIMRKVKAKLIGQLSGTQHSNTKA